MFKLYSQPLEYKKSALFVYILTGSWKASYQVTNAHIYGTIKHNSVSHYLLKLYFPYHQ